MALTLTSGKILRSQLVTLPGAAELPLYIYVTDLWQKTHSCGIIRIRETHNKRQNSHQPMNLSFISLKGRKMFHKSL